MEFATRRRSAGVSPATITVLLLLVLFTAGAAAQPPVPASAPGLELSRPVRPWEFLSAVGQKAGVFGNEAGTVEAWVYPLKLFRDFELVFHVAGRSIPAATLARTLVARPEAVSITYASDAFSVQETFFAPRDEPGAVIALNISTYVPLEIEARFRRDFQLMWPAALGGTYINWEPRLHAFALGEEQKKWFALVGSPSAATEATEYETNYSASDVSSFRLGPTAKGTDRKLIVIAGSVQSRTDADSTYQRLAGNYDSLRQHAAKEFADYLQSTTSLQLPDADLQRAYDWARVSVFQGLVTNPFLGTGLIAGYRTSGAGTRPGFAWFFGRDSLWTSLALNSEGDFASTRTALAFLMKYQRDDGKVEHEISQSASLVAWFKDYPYGFASADATPLFLIAMDDYLRASGDREFVQTNWDHLWRAYQFLRSTWDARGLPQNAGVGHGWVEGGPLLPVKTEFYQSGLGVQALQAITELARAAGHADVAAESERLFQQHRAQLNDLFWNPEQKFFAFALDQQDRRFDTSTVLTTVPMWFGLTDATKSEATITQLADEDHASDWGMRIMSARDPRFDPSGYHFGSVWPLFTGWAAVGEYRYHRVLPAYANLRANSLLALSGAAGHVTEVLSGAVFEPLSTSSPHQIWSAAMIISPLLRGLLGFEADTTRRTVRLAPHLPAAWTGFQAHNLRMGSATYDVSLRRDNSSITLEVQSRNAGGSTLEFAPALSPRAKVDGVEINGKKAPFQLQASTEDQHVVVPVQLGATSTVRIRLHDDFGLSVPSDLPPLGAPSRNLKIQSASWSPAKDSVVYEASGRAGLEYVLPVHGSARIARVEGAELVQTPAGPALRLRIQASNAGYQHARITVHFAR